jgi:glycosyltransferase involved in cell wall biosynthesis
MTGSDINKPVSLRGKTAVIVCHDWVYGPPHALRDYLLSHGINELLFIGHPNQFVKGNIIDRSYAELYKNGQLLKKWYTPKWKIPEMLAYLKDSYLSFVWTLQTMRGGVSYFFGVGNLNAFIGLVLKLLGLADSVIYYVIDYIPNRFDRKIINSIYHDIEYVCAKYSSVTWNYSLAMIETRNKYWKQKFPRQIVSPNGVYVRNTSQVSFDKIHMHEMLYMGSLTRQQGVSLVIDAIPLIKEKVPDVRVVIIGQGLMEKELKKLVRKLKVTSHVNFLGFIEDSVTMDERIEYAALGMATYIPGEGFVGYGEPGKVKRYLASGVPVIMTDVSPIAHDIVKSRCGFVVPYNSKKLANSVIAFFKKPDIMMEYRKNARRFAKKYTWEKIYSSAFQKTNKIISI